MRLQRGWWWPLAQPSGKVGDERRRQGAAVTLHVFVPATVRLAQASRSARAAVRSTACAADRSGALGVGRAYTGSGGAPVGRECLEPA